MELNKIKDKSKKKQVKIQDKRQKLGFKTKDKSLKTKVVANNRYLFLLTFIFPDL